MVFGLFISSTQIHYIPIIRRARVLASCTLTLFVFVILGNHLTAQNTQIPRSKPLKLKEPLDKLMVQGIKQYCLEHLENSRDVRTHKWNRDYSSFDTYKSSIKNNRDNLASILGVVDPRLTANKKSQFEFTGTVTHDSLIQDAETYKAHSIRWQVISGVTAEGLLLIPGKPKACVIAIPDADWTPEMFAGVTTELPPRLQIARRLAQQDCLVVVPMLISRDSNYSGNPEIRMTNQPHREFLYRQSFQLGRHVIGYEIQKILSAVDILEPYLHPQESNIASIPIGVVGIGEGGLLAFYASALDARIQATLISGYFEKRDGLWKEPIYRNVWSLLTEFGDSDIASLIAPRQLTIEACSAVNIAGPPEAINGQVTAAAPGRIRTAPLESVEDEFKIAAAHYAHLGVSKKIDLVISGKHGEGHPATDKSVQSFLTGLEIPMDADSDKPQGSIENSLHRKKTYGQTSGWVQDRQRRQFLELQEHAQQLMQRSFHVRDQSWQVDRSSLEAWNKEATQWRVTVHEEVIGKIADPLLIPNPRTKKLLATAAFTAYEIALDVIPNVITGGVLLIPNDLKSGERRPVVVCQHGLEGTSEDTFSRDPASYRFYKAFAAELCSRGFIVYAPQNPYRGKDQFRTIQRMANPLKLSLFSFIIAQHEQTVRWLGSLPFIDKDRIAFYGLSYGGKTAMRVPPFVPGYCLSICSGDFTDWIRVITTNKDRYGYAFTSEYEIPEWNIGHVANYAELAMLISPRPFMVEHGYLDGGYPTEWVTSEFGRVRKHYDLLGIGQRAKIEFFNGPHTINGVGTYEFLHKQLGWESKKR